MNFSARFAILAAFIVSAVSAKPLQKRALATVYGSCTKPNVVAMTFDDGPYIYLQSISDQLTAAGAKGTFFFNGNNYDCIYSADSIARVKYAYNAGHQVSQHTWSHADLTTLSTPQIQDAMYRMEEAFSRIIGVRPAFMRPPYGNYNDNVRTISGARGQNLALWDWDTGDADGNTTAQSEAVYQDAVNAKVSNMLVLNHETEQTTANTLVPFAIKLLQSHGYQLVTMAECLGLEPYQAIGVPQQQTSAWTCDGTPDPGAACSGSQCETGTPTLSGTSSGSSPTPPPTRSNQVIHPNGNTAKCLAAASNTNNAAVQIEDCVKGSTSQLWSVVGFNLQIYGNKCLDDTSGITTNGEKMQIYTCNTGNANQQWATTGSTIQLEGTSKCLDNTGGVVTDGNVAQIWDCTGGGNQKWQIVDGSTVTTTTTTTSSTTTSSPTGPTPTGKAIHPGKSSTTCLTASSNANNAAVVVKPCDSSASQAWTISGGTLVAYGNKCLDVTSGSTANGNKMQVYTCSTGNTNQQFSITADARIAWTNKGECLDLTDGSLTSGNQVQMWKCTDGNTNQVWNIV